MNPSRNLSSLRINRRAAITVIVAASALTAACGGGDPPTVTPTQITIELKAARGTDPGMAAAWISDSAIVLGADGSTQLAGGAPLSTDMWFHIGSNAKAMLGMALAVQVEQGKLRWNSTLAEIFPDLATNMLPAYRNVTVDNLLSHRAGMVELLSGPELSVVPAFDGNVQNQRKQFVAWATSVPALGTPGQTYLYSNAGYGVAGAVLERITGQAFEVAMEQTLFKPLGLRFAFAYPPQLSKLLAQVATTQPAGHEVNAAGTALETVDLNDPLYTPPAYLTAAGHVSMPLGDFARFAQVQLQGLNGKATLLKADTYQRLHTSQGPIPNTSLGYSPGWVIEPLSGNTNLSWSVGQLIGFTATIMVSPKADRATVLVANYNDGLKPEVMDATARKLLALKP